MGRFFEAGLVTRRRCELYFAAIRSVPNAQKMEKDETDHLGHRRPSEDHSMFVEFLDRPFLHDRAVEYLLNPALHGLILGL